MTWLDAVFAILIGVSLFAGLRSGLVRVGIGLAAVFFAALGGLWFYRIPGHFLQRYLESRQLANFVGFLIVFAVIVFVGLLVARALAVLLKSVGFGWLDKLLGGAFGLIRGILLATVLLLAIMTFSPGGPPRAVTESLLAPHILGAANALAHLAPPNMRQDFEKNYEKVQDAWGRLYKKGVKDIKKGQF